MPETDLRFTVYGARLQGERCTKKRAVLRFGVVVSLIPVRGVAPRRTTDAMQDRSHAHRATRTGKVPVTQQAIPDARAVRRAARSCGSMCIMLHTPPAVRIRPKFFILNSLFTLAARTPPMPPPWSVTGPRETRRSPRLVELRRERRAEQRREERPGQRLERVLELLAIELRVQLVIQVETQVATRVQTRVSTQAKTRLRILLPVLPGELLRILLGTQARLLLGIGVGD